MLLEIPAILDANKLSNINKILQNATFVDGKLSAGTVAQRVKNNLEMNHTSQQAQYLDQLVVGSLAESEMFRNAVLPNKVAQPFFARYETGMAYGNHIDDPIMGSGTEKYRTDVATTIFLNEPEEYEGGELVINTTCGQKKVKLRAGDAVCYSANSLHHVAEVKSGVRLVAVLWLQSFVRDPAKRELLYELSLAREKMLKEYPDTEETTQVDHSYVNLVRMWSDT